MLLSLIFTFRSPCSRGSKGLLKPALRKQYRLINPHRQRLLVASQKKTTVTSTPAVAVPDPSTLPDPRHGQRSRLQMRRLRTMHPRKRQDTIYNVTRKAYLGSLPTQIQYGIANPVQISGFRVQGLYGLVDLRLDPNLSGKEKEQRPGPGLMC